VNLSREALQVLGGFCVLQLAADGGIADPLFDLESMRAPLEELRAAGLIVVEPKSKRSCTAMLTAAGARQLARMLIGGGA
jgi:hypothetical protein